MWVVYSEEVRGEVGTRSGMCYVEWVVWVHVPTPPILLSFFISQPEDGQCISVETCSCSLCNKFYTYLYQHIVVLDKYVHSILV